MPRKSHGSGSRRPVCVFCGLQGHTVEKCYKKHGYPPGYKPKTKQHVGSINQLEIAELSVPNQVACGSNQNSDVQTQSSPVFPFSQDQYHKLLALIQSPSPVNNATSTINALSLTSNFYIVPDMAGIISCSALTSINSFFWLIDTGATDHVICSLTLFASYKSITNLFINSKGSSYIHWHSPVNAFLISV